MLIWGESEWRTDEKDYRTNKVLDTNVFLVVKWIITGAKFLRNVERVGD